MLQSINAFYNSPDLPGDFLLKPLERYHRFFIHKISIHSKLKQVIWRIGHIVSGIIVYPILGIVNAIGLIVKLTGITKLKAHNRIEKLIIDGLRYRIEAADKKIACGRRKITGKRIINICSPFRIEKKHIHSDTIWNEMKAKVDQATRHFKKVHVQMSGKIDTLTETGFITIKLQLHRSR